MSKRLQTLFLGNLHEKLTKDEIVVSTKTLFKIIIMVD